MTLVELSEHYRVDAVALSRRIRELNECIRAEEDTQEVQRLRRRIAELRPILQQSRELAELTQHYYDRSYHKHEKYTL